MSLSDPQMEPRLDEVRRRLLDLTRRNRLLNHRNTGNATLHVVDELPEEVFRVLVAEGRRMQFLAREEAPAEVDHAVLEAEAPPPSDPDASIALAPIDEGDGRAGRHTDSNLQTALDGERLQARLLHLAREAASARDEQGANILYVTLGVVEWREGGTESLASRAPLVFVPVELTRKSVNSRHSVARFDDEVVTNPNLVELCRRQLQIDLPEVDPDGDEPLGVYFDRVRTVIATIPGWRLLPEIHLGLFSFAKLLMYRDLDPATWPVERPVSAHPLVRQLSGVAPDVELEAGAIPDPRTLDDVVRPSDCYQVLDADSSQQAAILAVKRGVSAVVEGPPGTGKSQTIANIIAECLSQGKTVLFVAEKSAALEVVHRRLASVGLGEFVLELHSRKASKRAVLDDLRRALEAGTDARPTGELDDGELSAARDRLNAYVRELHAPVSPLMLTPFAAISEAVALADEPEAICALEHVTSWTQARLADARDALDVLDARLARVGDVAEHPWRGSSLATAGLENRQRLDAAGRELLAALAALDAACGALAVRLETAAPRTPGAAAELVRAATLLVEAPAMAPDRVADRRWDALAPDVVAWLKAGRERIEHRRIWSRALAPEAELEDWREVRDRRRRQAGSLLRFVTPSWYGDGGRLDRHTLPGVRLSTVEQIAVLDALVASGRLRAEVESRNADLVPMFGASWQGIDGDWSEHNRFAHAAVGVRRLILAGAATESAAARWLTPAGRDELRPVLGAARRAVDDAETAAKGWFVATVGTAESWFGAAWADADLASVASRVSEAIGALDRFGDWADLRAALDESRATLYEPFADWACSPAGAVARGRLSRTFARHFYRLWLDAALEQSPALARFRGEEHERLVERFRALDTAWLEAGKRRLADLVRTSRPDLNRAASRASKLGIVQAEIRKQRNIMPLRRLLAVAGDVVQSIKPCFMMSPISVAQYLAPGAVEFDLVVFDEASQVEPADAYGAIARGRQLLLVGDERQLPPTSFFSKIESETDETGPNGLDAGLDVADLESVLALGIVRLPNRCRLRWHYRSRHASLIEFSNERFYDDAPLRVFPSPHTGRDELGLAFRYVAGGVYKRGAGQHNPVEAAEVAAEVMRHAVDRPDLSLGVGAFSMAQQRAIQDELERLRRAAGDERVERFFAGHPDEPFFVKNLETIQGDERDVILLSVGYGPDADGRLTMNFGPLNRDGGWRRLNVLVTRARRRVILFSSFRADQMNLGGTTARGVVALRDYLHYAEHGRMPSTSPPTGEHDSPFEADVRRALVDRGWEVHAQVGCAGFAIDLAVVDPERPGRYLLGIECDGATYHGSATARDRDRLRQNVLEGLGWSIHRVWSTDWFHRRERTLERLLARLDAARLGVESVPQPAEPPPAVADPEPEDARPIALPRGVVPYVRETDRREGDRDALPNLPPKRVATLVVDIVRVESPIHVDEALKVLASWFGRRRSKLTDEAFHRGLAAALAAGQLELRGEFLWSGDSDGLRVRQRGEGCPVTRPEAIAPEEYREAVRLALEREFGVRRDALVTATARLMGFSRAGTSVAARIDAAIGDLVASGELELDAHGFVVLASGS